MNIKKLYQSIVVCSLATSVATHAQDDDAITANADPLMDEVVVTGSYIKRDKVEMASPVDTINSEDVSSSG